jgi:hypothetical protein
MFIFGGVKSFAVVTVGGWNLVAFIFAIFTR